MFTRLLGIIIIVAISCGATYAIIKPSMDSVTKQLILLSTLKNSDSDRAGYDLLAAKGGKKTTVAKGTNKKRSVSDDDLDTMYLWGDDSDEDVAFCAKSRTMSFGDCFLMWGDD